MDPTEIISVLITSIMEEIENRADNDANAESLQNNILVSNVNIPHSVTNNLSQPLSYPAGNSSPITNNDLYQHQPSLYPMWLPQYYMVSPSSPTIGNVQSTATNEPSATVIPPVQHFYPQQYFPYYHQPPAPLNISPTPQPSIEQNNQPCCSKDNNNSDTSSLEFKIPSNVTSFVDTIGRSWFCMDIVKTKEKSATARKKLTVPAEKNEKCLVLRLGKTGSKPKEVTTNEKFKEACVCKAMHKFPIRQESSQNESNTKSTEKPLSTLKWADEEKEKKANMLKVQREKIALKRLTSELIRSISYIDRAKEDADEIQPESKQSTKEFYDNAKPSTAGISLPSVAPRVNVTNRNSRRSSTQYQAVDTEDSLTSIEWNDDNDVFPTHSKWSPECPEEWQDGPTKQARSVKKIQSDGFVRVIRRRGDSPTSEQENSEIHTIPYSVLHRNARAAAAAQSRPCEPQEVDCECRSARWRSESTHTHNSSDNSSPASGSQNHVVFRPLPSMYNLRNYPTNVDRPLEENMHRGHYMRHVPVNQTSQNQPEHVMHFGNPVPSEANAETQMLRARRLRLFANANNTLQFQRITPPIMETSHDRPRSIRTRRWLGRMRAPRNMHMDTHRDLESMQHRRQRSANTVRPIACPRRNPKLEEEFNRIKNLDGGLKKKASSGKEDASSVQEREREEREERENEQQDQDEDKQEYGDEF